MVCGCASQTKYRVLLDTWVGKPADQLVMRWGPPHRVFTLTSGEKVFTYITHKQYISPGVPPAYRTVSTEHQAISTPIGGFPPTVQEVYCETHFTMNNSNHIKFYSFSGSGCVL